MSTSHRIGVCSWDRLGHAHPGLVGLGENGYPLPSRSPYILWPNSDDFWPLPKRWSRGNRDIQSLCITGPCAKTRHKPPRTKTTHRIPAMFAGNQVHRWNVWARPWSILHTTSYRYEREVDTPLLGLSVAFRRYCELREVCPRGLS